MTLFCRFICKPQGDLVTNKQGPTLKRLSIKEVSRGESLYPREKMPAALDIFVILHQKHNKRSANSTRSSSSQLINLDSITFVQLIPIYIDFPTVTEFTFGKTLSNKIFALLSPYLPLFASKGSEKAFSAFIDLQNDMFLYRY